VDDATTNDGSERERALITATAGAAFTEYVVLVGVVGLVAAAALAALGAPLLHLFFYAQTILDLPVP
jgi:Flp pilus assembly pilin Flp